MWCSVPSSMGVRIKKSSFLSKNILDSCHVGHRTCSYPWGRHIEMAKANPSLWVSLCAWAPIKSKEQVTYVRGYKGKQTTCLVCMCFQTICVSTLLSRSKGVCLTAWLLNMFCVLPGTLTLGDHLNFHMGNTDHRNGLGTIIYWMCHIQASPMWSH